jgi:[ribosomal protein S18]-alanine N-acetyltransferase
VTEIRLATLGDASALSALHSASFDQGWSEDDFATWLSRTEGFAMLATREREAIAFGLALEAGDDAELLAIASAPAERRAGLGLRIFQALDTEANKRSLKRWVLEVAHKNLPALALYKSAGFMEIGVRKGYYPTAEGRADALMLARPVGDSGGHQVA